MSTFKELTIQAMQIAEKVAENGGELTPELEMELYVNDKSLQEKAASLAYVCERFEAEAAFQRARAEECMKQAKGFERAVERIRDAVKQSMRAMMLDELQGPEVKFKLSKIKPKLLIDEVHLDPAFTMQVTEVRVDKERIRKTLEEGQPVKGAHLEPNFALRITRGKPQ